MSAEGQHKAILENGWFVNNTVDESGNSGHCKLHGYTVRQMMQNTFYLPTDTHNAEKRRVIKTF